MPKMFREDAVSGMLLVGAAPPEVLCSFATSSAPTVLVDNQSDATDCVVSDNFGGALKATAHLIGSGASPDRVCA